MSVPLVSYLITTHNEGKQIQDLLRRVLHQSDAHSNEVIVLDDNSTENDTLEILLRFSKNQRVKIVNHSLNNHYSDHKNYGNSHCSGKYIFQIDADELPHEVLLNNLHTILNANPDVDVFHVPRNNKFIGVTDNDIKTWGWRVNEKGSINWPDYQSRIYRNIPDRIKWERKLHETIVGMKTYSYLPCNIELSLYHEKTIEKQRDDNRRYNEKFSPEDNTRSSTTPTLKG